MRSDGINFSLKDFDYQIDGTHTYSLINDSFYQYQVSPTDNNLGANDGYLDQNILNSHFTDIPYLYFYSQLANNDESGVDDIQQNGN